jgi:hypothetical protein
MRESELIKKKQKSSRRIIFMKEKVEYKFITFEEIESSGRTKKFICKNIKSEDILGFIRWYSFWRQYIFYPEPCLFSKGCLDDISHFLNLIKDLRNDQSN